MQYRKRKVFFGTSGHWPELLTVMAKHKTEKYLFPLSEGTSLEIAGQLDQKKIKHTECTMFRTVQAKLDEDTFKNYDMILIFTPVGVQSLLSNFPKL